MKFLTLNTHSWMEKDPQEKFRLLLQDILEQDYDLICFQEINQEISSILAETDEFYHPLPSAEPIHQDHYIYLLVQELKKAGREYYWTWPTTILAMIDIMKVLEYFLKTKSKHEKF